MGIIIPGIYNINLREVKHLPGLTNIELDSLREALMEETLAASKFSAYAQSASDPNLKNFLNKAAQDAQRNIQTLKQFLS